MSVAAITGATGFIGKVVAETLRAQGWQMRALARSKQGQCELEALGLEVVRGALSHASALQELTDNADAVIHCAGAVRGADYADFEAVNVQGTANLLCAMPHVPLVVLSSLAAREPQLSHYARSKRAMESLLSDQSLTVLALRPPAVYGPGERELMPLFQALARGVAPLPAPPDARVSLIYVDDLANAIAAWLAKPETGGVFAIHDGQPDGYSWQQVVEIAEGLLGRRIRRLALPAAPLRLFSQANARASRILGYQPMLTPGKLRELQHANWVCDNSALQQVVAWQPEIDLRAGLQRTCGWGNAA